jgi:hypothetical protein
MTRQRGTEVDEPERPGSDATKPPGRSPAGRRPAPGAPPPAGLPDAVRKLIALGLSGVFSTQETLRQAVGDALPKEWVDFAADQSERTRAEFLERLAGELARTIESIDLARVMQQALEGRTLEVHARIRMLPDEDPDGRGGLRITMTEDDES